MALEEFAKTNGDDAVLFGPNKRPFLAATIQTYMRKFAFDLSLSLCYLLQLVRGVRIYVKPSRTARRFSVRKLACPV